MQVPQLYRIPSDTNSTELERLTYFDIDSGGIILSSISLLREGWRGAWHARSALMVMDLTGNENFRFWYVPEFPSLGFLLYAYRENADSEATFPKIDSELDNRLRRGRFECLTDDHHSYQRLPHYDPILLEYVCGVVVRKAQVRVAH